MRKLTLIGAILIFFSFVSCQNDDWKDAVGSIQKELDAQAQLIEQIQKGITIKNVTETDNGYIVLFSDGKTMNINNGDNGNDAPIVTSIIKTETVYKFIFSDGTSLEVKIDQKLRVLTWGDSLTAGAGASSESKKYPSVLQTLLGENYEVINMGVGGETIATIAARHGSVPASFSEAFVLPANTNPVEVSSQSNYRLKNKFDKSITPLLQGVSNQINPIYVQGIECTLTYDKTKASWSIQRNTTATSSFNVITNSPIFTIGATKYRNSEIQIIWAGNNNGGNTGHDDDAMLLQYYKDMISFSGTSNIIIIGMPPNSATTTAGVQAFKDRELLFAKEFGLRYINWREYASTYALSDAGIAPTQADKDAVSVGKIPPSLLKDAIHYNDIGQKLIAELVHKRMQMLGML